MPAIAAVDVAAVVDAGKDGGARGADVLPVRTCPVTTVAAD